MSSPLPPGAVLGVLGGGQLGRIFTLAARRMGYPVSVFAPVQPGNVRVGDPDDTDLHAHHVPDQIRPEQRNPPPERDVEHGVGQNREPCRLGQDLKVIRPPEKSHGPGTAASYPAAFMNSTAARP